MSDKILSVIIPIKNEAGNILPLTQEIVANLTAYAPVGEKFEIIFADDGSTDKSAEEVQNARKQYAQIRLIQHQKPMGKSAAIRNAVRIASANWIMTIDGDMQNDPADIPNLCDIAWYKGMESKNLVTGIRTNRKDSESKRMASKIANKIRAAMLNDHCPDTNCGLKLFPRSAYLELPFFLGLHRFMPAMFKLYGYEVIQSPVNDRPRLHGASKYGNLTRAIKGFFDLLGVYWLIKRTPYLDRSHEVPPISE